MNPAEVIQLAQRLFNQHGIINWKFDFDRAKRRAGQCNYSSKTITISSYYVQHSNADQIEQVILHEIAHAIAGNAAGHKAQWREAADAIGYRHEKLDANVLKLTASWIGRCAGGHSHYRNRKPTRALSCRLCSKRFASEHQISWARTEPTRLSVGSPPHQQKR